MVQLKGSNTANKTIHSTARLLKGAALPRLGCRRSTAARIFSKSLKGGGQPPRDRPGGAQVKKAGLRRPRTRRTRRTSPSLRLRVSQTERPHRSLPVSDLAVLCRQRPRRSLPSATSAFLCDSVINPSSTLYLSPLSPFSLSVSCSWRTLLSVFNLHRSNPYTKNWYTGNSKHENCISKHGEHFLYLRFIPENTPQYQPGNQNPHLQNRPQNLISRSSEGKNIFRREQDSLKLRRKRRRNRLLSCGTAAAPPLRGGVMASVAAPGMKRTSVRIHGTDGVQKGGRMRKKTSGEERGRERVGRERGGRLI
ncbi:hypothetical protein ACLB2K_058588 [Fragaria x ananassa]